MARKESNVDLKKQSLKENEEGRDNPRRMIHTVSWSLL
jgi:hypothetical protein